MQSDSFSDVTGATVSFVVAFVVGTALMILCRILFPFTPVANLSLGSMLSTAVAVVVLILYGWYACRKSPRWETMARTGDDLYYLGLLFTLVSLIYSLIVLFILGAPGDAVDRTHELIGSFGVALISTVTGILGRVILHSLQAPGGRVIRSDPSGERVGTDVDDGAVPASPPGPYPDQGSRTATPSDDLEGVARRLRAEMRGAADALSHFNRMTMLQAENTKLYAERISQEFAAKLKQDTATAVAETAAVYEKWAGRVEATTRDIEHRISAIAGELGALVERLGSVTDAFEQTAQGAGETRRDIETLGSSISEANDNFTRKVVASVAAIEALAVRLKEHQEIEQSAHEKTMAVTAQTRIDIETIGQTFRTATDAFGRLSDQIAGDCERFSRSALEQLRAGEEHSARMDRAFVEWEGRIEKTAASLVLLLERINSVTESFGRGAAATEQTQLAEDAGNRLKLNTRVLAKARNIWPRKS